MENVPEHIDELIAKSLAGEAGPDERATLGQWVNASEDNRRYFRSFEILFDGAAAGKQKQQFDTDAAWNALREKVRQSSSDPSVVDSEKASRSWYWKAAAAILLIMAAGYLVIRQSPENPVTVTVESGAETLLDTLPDGSTAFLNASSTLAYEYTVRDESRRLTLKGEAYFSVDHAEESPFIIECAGVFIKDLGTTFNVRAYPESPTVEVYVESGEVAFYTESDDGLYLRAGETGTYTRRTGTFIKSSSHDENILSYKTRIFNFSDADLRSVVEDLNKVYPTKVRLDNEKLGNCRLNVTFREESIEDITGIIAETLGLSATKGNGEIILGGAGCEQ